MLSLQTCPRVQGDAPPTQLPAEQESPAVQKSPSLQGTVLLANWQPVAGTQVSVVHRLPSLQVSVPVALHEPPLQVSPVVQALLSLQGPVLFTFWQPRTGLQESVVQVLPSLQLGAGPPTQVPAPLQVSLVVQALLSLHADELGVNWQPLNVLHVSSVHALESLQTSGDPPTQMGAVN